jgi:ribokinase
VAGGELLTFAGGKGANQAVAAARLGARVSMVGRVGDDDSGRGLVAGLAAEGIDVAWISRDPSVPTGAALILVDEDGQNLIAVAPGANATVGEEEVKHALSGLGPGDLLVLQLEIPMAAVRAAVARAASQGARVVLNAAPPAELNAETLRALDVLVVNGDEARALSGRPSAEAATALARRGPAAVLVTLGERGAVLSEGERSVVVAPRAVRAVDTTAAGDAFVGGLAAGLAAGSGMEGAVSLANAAGAAASTVVGAQASLPSREDLVRLFGGTS